MKSKEMVFRANLFLPVLNPKNSMILGPPKGKWLGRGGIREAKDECPSPLELRTVSCWGNVSDDFWCCDDCFCRSIIEIDPFVKGKSLIIGTKNGQKPISGVLFERIFSFAWRRTPENSLIFLF
jgi:hypothetical protein